MKNLRSPLHEVHLAAGARLVPFGGWDMPLAYKSGTVAEHLACRSGAVMFDVSHLGTVRVTGSDAFGALQWAFTNDLRRIGPGAAQYTHLLDPADASVVDDIIVWWVTENSFDVMPNASNTDGVVAALTDMSGIRSNDDGECMSGIRSDDDERSGVADVMVQDITTSRAVIAVQGPEAKTRLADVSSEVASVGRFKVVKADCGGVPVIVAGTGYTGEPGVEMSVPAKHGPAVWEMLIAAGVTPAGLGARDTLRLEAGLPLYGHELGPGITPLQAGLGWVTRFDKGAFRGRDALDKERASGPHRLLRGLLTDGRRPPRQGGIVSKNETPVGEITSGNFSPVLGRGIALALLDSAVTLGDQVIIEVRGREMDAVVVKPPFHRLTL